MKINIEDYEVKEDLLWWQKKGLSYTATGYSSKIPTSKKIKIDNRWYRIYCQIYSNVGTCYIIKNKTKIIVD